LPPLIIGEAEIAEGLGRLEATAARLEGKDLSRRGAAE
jgi:hypothetical protein